MSSQVTLNTILTLMLTVLSTPLLAVEDYAEAVGVFSWIPSDQTREDPGFRSVQNHYVHKAVFSKKSDGKYKLELTLPEDISGGIKKIIRLDETARRPQLAEYDFSGTDGSFTCIAEDSWMKGSCNVAFVNPGPSRQEHQAFLQQKYSGTRREFGQDLVVGINAEPFGDIRFSDPEFMVEGSSYGNGHWQTIFTPTGGASVSISLFVDFDMGMLKQGQTNGTMGGVFYDGNVMEAGWNIGDQQGWMRLEFNGDTFTGTYGFDDSQDVKGTWTGTLISR